MDEQNIYEAEQSEIVAQGMGTVLAAPSELTFDQKKSMLNTITNFESIWDQLKKSEAVEVEAVNVLQLPIEQVDNHTGEVRSATRVIFVTEEGNSYATSSEAVKNTVDIMLAVMGDPANWQAPVRCIFRKEVSKNDNPFINLSF